jgi:hypothetical protein
MTCSANSTVGTCVCTGDCWSGEQHSPPLPTDVAVYADSYMAITAPTCCLRALARVCACAQGIAALESLARSSPAVLYADSSAERLFCVHVRR